MRCRGDAQPGQQNKKHQSGAAGDEEVKLRVDVKQQTGEEGGHRPAQRAPHPRPAEFKLALTRHPLGVRFQHADAAVKGQTDIDPAKDAAQQDVDFQQVAEQQIRRTREDQQRGDIPEQMFAQPQLVLDKSIANLRKQRGNRQYGIDNTGIACLQPNLLVKPDREQGAG